MMKESYMKYVGLFCLLLAGFTSCEMKDELWGKKNPNSPDEMGVLDLKLSVVAPSYTDSTFQKIQNQLIVPKAEAMVVKVFDESMVLQDHFETYADYKKVSPYTLTAGTYSVEAYSGEEYEISAQYPYYEMNQTCVVKKKEVTVVEAVCELQSALIYLVLCDEFLRDCKDDYAISITNGTGIMTIRKGDPTLVYLHPGQKTTITVRATTKETETPVIQTFILADPNGNVNKQDLFTIRIKELQEDIVPDEPEQPVDPVDPDEPDEPDEPEKPTKGKFTIDIDITLNDVPIDIVVPSGGGNGGTSGGNEGEGDGEDVEEGITMTGDAITTPLQISVPNGVKAMTVQITTSNTSFGSAIQDMGLSRFDMANLSEELKESLTKLGLIKGEIKGATSVTFDISGMMDLLGEFPGTHNFELKVTDNNGNSKLKTITKKIE